MAQYAGDPESTWPDDFTIPDDVTDPRDASSVNVAFEALGDRTARLQARTKLQRATNYTTTVAPGGVLNGALWNAFERKWYLYGDSGIIRSSSTNGWSWDASSLIAVPSAENEHVTFGDVDANGNMVFACMAQKDVFTYTSSTFTWAKVSPPSNSGATQFNTYPSGIAYDPIRGLWCWMQYDSPLGTPTKRCYTSPDRAVWTSRTAPTNFDQFNQFCWSLRANKTTGRLLWVGANHCATSDDGGVTWTARSNIDVSGTTSSDIGCLLNKPGTTEWLYVAGEVSGTPTGTVVKSIDDGETWTAIASFANNCLQNIAWVGNDLLIGTTRTSSLLCWSVDGGVTWQTDGFAVTATTKGAFAGNGGALLVSSGVVYPPFRAGVTGTVLT